MLSKYRTATTAGAALAAAALLTGCAATTARTSPAAAAHGLTTSAPAISIAPSTAPSTALSTTPALSAAASSAAASTTPPSSPTPAPVQPAAPGVPCTATAVACVSLSKQEAWFVRGGRVVLGPIKVATGRPGYRTELGTFHVYRKNRMWYSTIFNNAPMPYSVFFDGGEAFHEGSIYVMSHGCVHLDASKATTVFNLLQIGDEVQVVR